MRAETAMSEDGLRPRPASSLWRTAVAVMSAFFGVRKRADHESVRLNPVHVIVIALIGALSFIFALLAVVRIVTG